MSKIASVVRANRVRARGGCDGDDAVDESPRGGTIDNSKT